MMDIKKIVLLIRENPKIKLSIMSFLIMVSIYAFIQVFIGQSFIQSLLRFRMFTNISNTMVLVTLILYLSKHDEKRYFKYLSFITLINILMTGIIYHLWKDKTNNFNTHVVHTIVPFLYFIFYFLMVKDSINPKLFWIGLIWPNIYFMVILIQGHFTKWYPYFFINPSRQGSSLLSVLMLCMGLVFPVISLSTYVLSYLKNKLEKNYLN